MTTPGTPDLDTGLSAYLDAREAEHDAIDAERRAVLQRLADHLRGRRAAGQEARALFVCTHNSRRSQMAQLWMAAAARRAGLDLATDSGGTEATAFDPRAVASLERAGFGVEVASPGDNPTYHLRLSADGEPVACRSKRFDEALPPGQAFAAVMVCGEAEAACPFVPGADFRIPITYVDPKLADGTPEEAATYDERCAQIAREMLYVVDRVRA